MNARPLTSHYDALVRNVTTNLPDSLKERKTILVTLHSMLPKNYPHRDTVFFLISQLDAHERKQLNFLSTLNQTKP